MLFSFLFLFFLGLAVGSFLNVVVFRLETGESFVFGRSHCQSCMQELVWFENIPLLSFLFLHGKCRHCNAKLSWQYPLVEIITALTFAATALIFSYNNILVIIFALFFLLILSFAILIAIYDLRFSLIPDVFLQGINIATFSFLVLSWLYPNILMPLILPSPLSSVIGALVAGGFFFLLVWLSKETWMGWGDVWLGVWGGALLGIELTQLFITASFTLGAVIGVGLLLFQKKTLKAEIPFAPYILLAGFVLFFLTGLYPDIFTFLSPFLPGTIG